MKLIDFVKKYKGSAKFDVNSIIDDENKDVIVFANSEYEAVRDEIMNGEVVRYSVSAYVNNVPTINIAIKPEESIPETPPEPGETEPPKADEGAGTE